MEASPLNRPAEGGERTQGDRVGATANAVAYGASDAEHRYNDAWYAEVARHLDSGGYCLCVHCIGTYCFGTKASAVCLASAICTRKGIHPMKIAHTGV